MTAKAMTEEAANHGRQKPSPSPRPQTLTATLLPPDTAGNACKKPFVSAATTPMTLTVLARTCWLSGEVTQALNHVRRYEH